ncbi:hypothetical protein JAAARDRAFT_186303 [Jaapia argillacea MUCL 33604]|uniref:Phosphoglycerate mutase-like protein n=1 Tax=Jaapia argillacea MUCL 33604 TaxID=933084 RepID=A0A067PIT4_9AGAM|nr:hypothetical protein JAAARDRAFT_186303 [Jaapia argillacea MUCL 33604]
MVNITAGLLGVVLIARHGDRLEFFQDPYTYTPTATYITPLGEVEEYISGQNLASLYLTPSSPSYINGINTTLADIDQLVFRADASGEGTVILNSMYALVQGMFPPTTYSNVTLSNGTTVTGPLGGYQYIPIQSVENTLDISLNSFTSCPNFDNHTAAFYASPQFQATAMEAAPFLMDLAPYLDGRSTNFTNMFNIFDYVNVQSIHNKTFYDMLPPTFLEQAYYYANFHEYGVFSDVSPGGIGNIAIQTVLPSIFTDLQSFANTSNPLKLALNGVSYKPFISLFNITQATVANPEIAGIVDYASVVALELSEGADGPTVTMKFRNGTTDMEFTTLPMFGNLTSVPLTQFINALAPYAINTTAEWCYACNQTTLNGCAACTLP